MVDDAVDVCFVGAGISCLYAARELLRRRPDARVLLLERTRRAGGRAWGSTFAGVTVSRGAGVVRVGTDRLLSEVIAQISPQRGGGKAQPPGPGGWLALQVRRLRKHLSTLDRSRETFEQYARRVLGDAGYERFTAAAGFTDFELADACDTVLDYGLEDLYAGRPVAGVPWQALIRSLVRALPAHSVRLGAEVSRLEKEEGGWTVHLANGGAVRARRVVVGGTASTLRALFPLFALYDDVRAQPFTRVYAQVAPGSGLQASLPPGRLTVLRGDLQKAAHVGRDVYLLAYADNAHAERVARMSKAELQAAARDALGAPRLRVKRMLRCWWLEGTHYYTPLNGRFRDRDTFLRRAQRPAPGVYAIGEALSRKQGWCEGALESALAIMDELSEAV
jgi:glycine/D-amino acid oxidase-like deaminating enzyme